METIQYKSFISLIEEIDLQKRSQRDRGTLFELLVQAYLLNEPMYAKLYDAVWMLHDVPGEYKIPKKDTGVDLVARTRKTGKLVAVQCKYYAKDRKIDKKDIDSFLNEVGKRYYSEGIVVSSTDNWTQNADTALLGRNKPIVRIGLSELQNSKIDWSVYSFSQPKNITLQKKKEPRQHQVPAIQAVISGFEFADRGKLIMAPGTGKTYTSMAIAEELAKKKGSVFRVLYLVPSIQLLSQSLRGWTGDTNFDMDTIAVCSDRKVTKGTSGESELEDIAIVDLGYPATTNYEKLLEYQAEIDNQGKQSEILTVFSTYQSIEVVIEAQNHGFYEFDLVICDEAHRTTGSTEAGKEASAFTKVHSEIKTRKLLYQTATPRVYGDKAKQKADEMSVLIADMNDQKIYGEEFYRIGFGDAVNKGILTDYKVMVLAVDESMIAKRFQTMFSDENGELRFDDVTKIIGCWNGLIKRKSNSNIVSSNPMQRAIAFTGTIKESKLITNMFKEVVDLYINASGDQTDTFRVEIDHADGSMNALQKNKKIDWLKSDVPNDTCRILSNARFLTEGVDVPDLDAVMFLKPRKSRIDIAQAVGRVMRKVPGKEYGYVILPIGIPDGTDENTILDNNEKYRVVWEVLNALRSLDERFDATINKLELNKTKPNQIQVIGVGDAPEDGQGGFVVEEENEQGNLFLEDEWSDIERSIYGKIVKKVGNVRYWEEWSKDVAIIAKQHITRINAMLEDKESYAYQEFSKFLSGLRHNINKSITENDVIEMLAQHMITKPVFDALFEQESFALNNPVSQAMDGMISVLESLGLAKEQESLEGFYESVRVRAQGIDNLQAKQDIIVQLYNKFFKVGFPSTTEKLGIVFTPTEVVDFIIHSVDDALGKHFGKSISDEGINILDPFTGTGTFITRLLQSGLLSKEDMFRKYTYELHANEIVLLSYYIAAINIEETYNSIMGTTKYKPFEGIVLTDTFESTEIEDTLDDEFFGDNDERLNKQKKLPITVIIGNPPYAKIKSTANDFSNTRYYPILDEKIKKTYAKESEATLKNALQDSYIRSLRWASDRIRDKGVIGFITNNGYIDSPSLNGVRRVLNKEFNHIYIINLKGAVRGLSPEAAKRQGQNIFDIMTGVAIVLLIKDGSDARYVNYYDIGDYLNKEEKLNILSKKSSIKDISFTEVHIDKNGDWVNQRDAKYDDYYSLGDGDKKIFQNKLVGFNTNRDFWTFNFSRNAVSNNISRMINNYNNEIDRLNDIEDSTDKLSILNSEESFISWSRGLKNRFIKNSKITFNADSIIITQARPFTKKYVYYNRDLVEMPGKFDKLLPENELVLYTPGPGGSKTFSVLFGRGLINLQGMGYASKTQTYPLKIKGEGMFSEDVSNIIDESVKYFGIKKEHLVYYIYAILHSKDFKNQYEDELFKIIPRIPLVKYNEKYIEIGEKLAFLHLNYEDIPPSKEVKILYNKENPSYRVQKMKHPKKDKVDTIVFNSDITITNIPEQAYEYVINGRSAIEWIIDQYQVKTDRNSGLLDDPNEYSEDPKYIFNLLLSVINVSLQTVNLINSLPSLEIIE